MPSSNNNKNNQVFEMTASCAHFHHPDPECAAFRTSCGLYCGDFELDFYGVPKDMAQGWERDQKYYVRGKDRLTELFHCRVSPEGALVGQRVADVLWKQVNFGCLKWDWASLSNQGSLGHRIWGQLGPDATYLEVMAESRKIRKRFQSIPSTEKETRRLNERPYVPKKPYSLIPPADFAKIIMEDCEALMKLILDHGTMARAMLPEGLDRITASYENPRNGGNIYEAVFETRKTRFVILFATS